MWTAAALDVAVDFNRQIIAVDMKKSQIGAMAPLSTVAASCGPDHSIISGSVTYLGQGLMRF